MEETADLIRQAETLYKEKKFKEIIALLPDELLKEKNDPELFSWRAMAYDYLAEPAEAIRYFDLAISADPTFVKAYINRGVSKKKLGEYDSAIEDYTKAIELQPDNALAYSNRGITLNDKGEYDRAIADLTKAIELNPGYYTAYFNRGTIYDDKGEFDLAIGDYSKAIELKKDDPDYFNNLGVTWKNKGDYDKALDNYVKALELKPDDPMYLNNIGNAYYHLGDLEKALELLNHTLNINSSYAYAYRNRGRIFYEKGDFRNALVDFEKAREYGKGTFDFLEKDIKLVKEKIEERKILQESNAEEKDKLEKVRIEREIERIIHRIRESARSNVKTVVHYTKLFVGEIYVSSLGAKMQYSNAIYMNDPMEGKVFFDFLDDKEIAEAYVNGERRTETSVYLGSFLPAEEIENELSYEDELVMWRTYGKDENGKEAAGCSVVLSSDFFKIKRLIKEEQSTKDKSEELLNVIYLKLKNGREIVNDIRGEIEPALAELRQNLRDLIVLRDKYKPRDDFYREIENTIFRQLSTITYLFKSSDYNFEHEVRVITYMPRNSDLIHFRSNNVAGEPKKRFYIESYNYILPFIKKIFLGPKVENHQQWSLYLDFEIRQRAKDLAEMKDTPAPFQLNPSSIEILKSECRFQ